MLERQIPRPGEADLRHFEWHFLNRQTHPEAASFTLPGVQPNAIVTPAGASPRETATFFSRDGTRAALFHSPSARLAYGPNDERGTVKVWDVATRKLLLNYTLAEDERASAVSAAP
jgi:hypothetical protein